MSFRSTNICQTCLSDNRVMYPLCEIQPILKELQFLQIINVIGGICWECKGIIMKMQKFKNQVLKAQNILYLNTELQYLGGLTTISKIEYDYKFDYTPKENINGDECSIKVEQKTSIDDMSVNGIQDCMSHRSEDIKFDMCTETNFSKKMNLRVKKDKNNANKRVGRAVKKKFKNASREKEDEELRDKFTMVIFSEEEMVRNREEKRNQPNFKKIPYKCDTCVLGFTRKETYDLHYEKKHDESIGPYTCTVCATRFPTPRAMESHRRRHYSCYRCRLCKYETLQRGSALAHCSTKHAGDRSGWIHCGQCGFVAGTPEDLMEHKRIEHMLHCNECGEKFKGKHTLRTHKIRIHTSNRDYSCDICGRSFKTKSRLESHMTNHNAALAQKLSYCGICNVQYKNIYVYRNHLKNSTNHSERVYHCPDCNKRFASKVYWRKHCDFYHRNKSQFKCNVCEKLLISEWRLKSHMQTRHGSSRTRDHPCDVCGKSFFTMSTLRAHQLTHSTERSYMCEQCGDTFKQRAALHTHMRALHACARARAT